MRPPGRPGSPGRAGGALRERGHGGGDRPIPSRTRQLSPPSPKVLRIRSAGGRDAALAQGASAPIGGRARAGEGPQGPFRASRGPCGPLSFFRGGSALFPSSAMRLAIRGVAPERVLYIVAPCEISMPEEAIKPRSTHDSLAWVDLGFLYTRGQKDTVRIRAESANFHVRLEAS